MKRCLASLLLAVFLLPLCAAADDTLAVALETNRVEITPYFAGTDIHAFGSIARGGDVIIKVVGPEQDVTLTREVQYGPFWVSGGNVQVSGAPSLLYVYTTRPLAEILPTMPANESLALEHVALHMEPRVGDGTSQDWRKAFFRLKEREHYYRLDDHAVKLIGNRLFVADIPLPGNLQVGNYEIETLLVRSGKVIGRNITHFEVRQVGIERWTWNAAQKHPWLFGSLFTLSAMLLGFSLNAVTHRHRQ